MKTKSVILVVDDQLQNIDLLEAFLLPVGYEIIKATNGEEALAMLRGTEIDLILLDVMMPVMDGFEVIRKVRQDKKHRLLPIILVTALRETEDRVKGIEAGCDDFISKPIEKIELLARIRSLLKIKAYNDLMTIYRDELEALITRILSPTPTMSPVTLHITERFLDSRLESLAGNDEISSLAVTFNQNLDRIENAYRFQEQLVSDLSHQLRTPLTAMRGSIEVAMHKARSVVEYQAILDSNLAEIDRITALVNTMLMLAKLDGHIERLQYSESNLVELLEETVSDLTPLWTEKSIRFIYRFIQNNRSEEFRTLNTIVPSLPSRISDLFNIEVDVFRFKQAIINILDNAYKYTPEGGRIVFELCPEVPGDSGTCCFAIMNNGPAIPEATLPHLFTRFFQVDIPEGQPDAVPGGPVASITRGFGLGLSICRRIVEMHRGKIRAFNPETGGAAFEIVIPVRQPGR
jgi:signal transduction histidine kinase